LDFTLTGNNDDPYGVAAVGDTVWVADFQDGLLYAYDADTRSYDAARNIDLDPDNDNPFGVASAGKTIWVADLGDRKLYGYDSVTLQRDSSQDISLGGRVGSPRGAWSDGVTVWVANKGADAGHLYAYDWKRNRQAGRDLPLHTLNEDPWGVWSDGVTMWVADIRDHKIYSYNMPQSDSTELGRVTVDGTEIDLTHKTDGAYVHYVPAEVTEVTVAAGGRQLLAEAQITAPGDADELHAVEDGRVVGIDELPEEGVEERIAPVLDLGPEAGLDEAVDDACAIEEEPDIDDGIRGKVRYRRNLGIEGHGTRVIEDDLRLRSELDQDLGNEVADSDAVVIGAPHDGDARPAVLRDHAGHDRSDGVGGGNGAEEVGGVLLRAQRW